MSNSNSYSSSPGGNRGFISGEIEFARSDVARAQEHLETIEAEQAKLNDLQVKLSASLKANEQKLSHAHHVVTVRKRALFQMENGASA